MHCGGCPNLDLGLYSKHFSEAILAEPLTVEVEKLTEIYFSYNFFAGVLQNLNLLHYVCCPSTYWPSP